MTKIDELKKSSATAISCCILFVALHGDANAQVLAEEAAREYLSLPTPDAADLACSCGSTALMRVLLCDDCGGIIMPPSR